MEFSIGTVIFDSFDKPLKVLIIHQKRGLHFGFPKGHMEDLETYQETALRETKEEVGLDVTLNDVFYDISYHIKKDVPKTVRYYLALAQHQNIIIQQEEILDAAFYDIKEAFKRLTYDNDRQALQYFLNILSEA
jgi:8-oxo-dGTP pyrophosphatase MutT (NUDIX family)